MKTYLRAFMAGVAFMLGVAALASSIVGIHAATIALFTVPGGTNPAIRPDLIPDLNALIGQINSNAAFADTGTPSNAIGAMPVTTNTISSGASTSVTLLQLMPTVFTTTTNTATCDFALSTGCFMILDANGKGHWVPWN